MTLRFGLVGYGFGGRRFHAPYLAAAVGCELVGVVARAPQRVAEVREDLGDLPVHESLAAMIDAGVDAVAISTPPATRGPLVLEAVAHGVHVVADKPFAPTAAHARALADAAAAAGVLLNVFHNRRYDSDIVTATAVLTSGVLGRVSRMDLRCDQDGADTFEGGPEGGLLRDLGSHLVDQALHLLGPVRRVQAQLDWTDTTAGPADSGFVLTLEHVTGSHSHVSSSKLNGLVSRELRLHGEAGSYTSDYTDVQIDAILAGQTPADDRRGWGYEQPARWGVLRTGGETRSVPSEQGDYTALYEAFASAVADGSQGPVPATDGIAVLSVLDAARVSAEQRRPVEV